MNKVNGQHPLGGFADHKSCCRVRTNTFKDSDCKIALPGSAETWICLSGGAYQREHSFHEKLCDLLFAWEMDLKTKVSAPVELKSGHVDVSYVQQQLQNGADIIDDLLKGIQVATILPVLVHKSISTAERRMLRYHKISFRGKRSEIVTIKSGGNIASLTW